MNKKWLALAFLLLTTFGSQDVFGQSLPLNFPAYGEAIRRAQLLGMVDSSYSFNLLPVRYDKLEIDSAFKARIFSSTAEFKLGKKVGEINILPIQLITQYTSSYPYSWGDGPMIPSKGIESYVSPGISVKAGIFSMQFRPEFVWAANQNYPDFPSGDRALLTKYYGYQYNRTDIPHVFGNGPYKKAFLGQSNIGVNLGPIFVGLSSQNIWWGPGKRNALIMSNNAPGFNHITINTNSPIKTGIGSFEMQTIVGKLVASGFKPSNLSLYKPPIDDWRYLSGIVINYSPKWIKGLHIGGSRVMQQYYSEVKKYKYYYPLFASLLKRKNNFLDDSQIRDSLLSIFLRWVWSEANAEFYFEFGRNDAQYNLRDFIMSPEHSRAYIVGVSKLLPFNGNSGNIQFNAEITHLEQSTNYLLRDAKDWYTHYQIHQGYTQMGQVLGAGIGPGSDLQSIEVSWVRDLDKIGVMLERKVNNNDFFYTAFSDNSKRGQWVDLGLGLLYNKQLSNIVVTSKLVFIESLNYWWQFKTPPSQTIAPTGLNKFNVFADVNVIYRFNRSGK